MGEIWAIILAGGESKRMGFPKMLLNFNGKSMLERVIENVTGSEVDNTLVVLGAEREKITDMIKDLNVTLCYNDNYKLGMLSSVRCGIQNLPVSCSSLLVFQGDQPLITPRVTNMVIEAYHASEKEIVIPVYNKKRGHPLMAGRKYFDRIMDLNDNEGLRSLAYLFPDDVLEVETEDHAILRDIDTYEDYKKEINQ
jgi:molybdenum cofactor cytidylyltransferase